MPSLPYLAPIVMLALSNVFMTFAWYGHLKFDHKPLWLLVMASWGIAFFEYWLAVPANRIGHQVYSAAELKTMQEVITLAVFARGLMNHVTTRAYFADEPLNEADPILALVPEARRPTMLARETAPGVWTLDIRLQGADETVFLDI
jgi:uncharacterized protein (DUF486 family)